MSRLQRATGDADARANSMRFPLTVLNLCVFICKYCTNTGYSITIISAKLYIMNCAEGVQGCYTAKPARTWHRLKYEIVIFVIKESDK